MQCGSMTWCFGVKLVIYSEFKNAIHICMASVIKLFYFLERGIFSKWYETNRNVNITCLRMWYLKKKPTRFDLFFVGLSYLSLTHICFIFCVFGLKLRCQCIWMACLCTLMVPVTCMCLPWPPMSDPFSGLFIDMGCLMCFPPLSCPLLPLYCPFLISPKLWLPVRAFVPVHVCPCVAGCVSSYEIYDAHLVFHGLSSKPLFLFFLIKNAFIQNNWP